MYQPNTINDENLLKILTEKGTNTRNKFKSTECLINVLTKNGHIGRDDIKKNSVILKIGYVPLGDKEEVTVVSLFGNGSEDNLMNLLRGFGSLYLNGHNPRVDRLYPRVEFPVGRGTPMISPYIRWNHCTERFVPEFHLDRVRLIKRGIRNYRVGLADPQWAFIGGHLVDGKVLFPAAGYLYMVWETFTIIQGVQLDASRVSLKNCKFLRTVSMPEKGSVDFTVSIAKGSGCFEVTEQNSVVVTGTIEFLPENESEVWNFAPPGSTQTRGRRLNKKEVYRELRIQGYHYSGEFRMVEEYDFDTSTLYVKWQENWISFLDNIMQSKLLESDSRIFQVPVWISEVNIAAHTHLDWIKRKLSDTTPNLAVHNDMTTGKIRSRGVTISGLTTRRIARRRDLRRPVLESYEFVPNCTKLDLHTSARVNIQIIIENTLVRKFKAVELVDEFSDGKAELLSPIIRSVLRDQPVVQPFVKILSAKVLDVDIEVENKDLETERNHMLVIASKIMERPEVLTSAFAAVKENGYVISRESCSFNIKSDAYPDIVIITVHKTPSETILLLRKETRQCKEHYIEVNTSENFSWLEETQNAWRRNSRQDLVLYSNDAASGILGLVNCLRKESGSSNVRCVLVMDEAGEINRNCDHLKKNMAFNVYKDGMWGTFRHLLLEGSNTVDRKHCFVNITTKGDLSSLKWTEGPLNHHAVPEPGKLLVYVYYSSVSAKDSMAAVGKNNTDMAIWSKLEQGFSLGFSGKDKRGRRVMGYCLKGALTNLLMADKLLTYDVPDAWTLEEAATVPVTYPTMIYALLMRGCMKKGDSILVHNGTGAMGQVAIHLALHYGCQVFTTVGSQAKREFIKNIYPQLKDENIGSFHDESFEQMVQERTNGRGVDIILNSLTEEIFVASVRCLAVGGRFLEIGKVNLAGNHNLSMLLFQKQASFHGITMDNVIDVETRSEIRKLFQRLMKEGAVKPFDRHVFKREEVDRAFRFMDRGNHVSEVLIRIREDDDLVPIPSKQTCISRYYCNPKKVFVIVGGLGGFGLELADWLVQRGARKLVLTSRKGIRGGYQQLRVSSWESYGVIVKISTALVTRKDGCEQLIQESLRMGRIAAIFNLAVVLEDAVFENQTLQSFAVAFEPKVAVTKHLDDITRTMCDDLRDFVMFSSFVCGKGNAGQTNYGMANSAMEQICRKRHREGYPALAIQWGAVGDVGTVAEMERYHEDLEIGGTALQSISSCLCVLDTMLTQRRAAVVSSVVVPRKQKALPMDESIVGTLINILGIRDAKYISLHVTLAELGLDSMMAIEVRSTLERDFGIFISAMDLRATSLARLKEMQEKKSETSLT